MSGMSKVAAEEPEGDEDPVVLEVPAEAKKMLTVSQQYDRNMRIVEARIRNKPWSGIAKAEGLTIRRCQQIFGEWAATNPTLREHDPVAIVDELLRGYQAVIEDLSVEAATSKMDAVRVGAHNSKLRAYREMAELLQAIGVLPNDLGTMHLHIDGQITAERVIAVLERHHVPEAVFEELLETLGGPPPELSAPVPS